MRHGIAGNKLGRNSSWRKATVRDIAKATLLKEQIKTTKAKAKEARKLVDKLITLGKKGQLAHKRRAFAILCDHKLVKELFDHIAPRFVKRAGGYTRLIPLGTPRRGDNADMVVLELTERKVLTDDKAKKAGSKKKAKAVAVQQEPEAGSEPQATEKDSSAAKSEKGKKEAVKKPVAEKKIKKETGLKKIFRRKSSTGDK